MREGDTIHFDIPNRKLDVEISDEGAFGAHGQWKKPEPKFKRGVFRKYVDTVSSASQGAVTN